MIQNRNKLKLFYTCSSVLLELELEFFQKGRGDSGFSHKKGGVGKIASSKKEDIIHFHINLPFLMPSFFLCVACVLRYSLCFTGKS